MSAEGDRKRERERELRDARRDREDLAETDLEGDSDSADSNPPRTTTGNWFTAPKFGSAGSGGAELEPGPEKD